MHERPLVSACSSRASTAAIFDRVVGGPSARAAYIGITTTAFWFRPFQNTYVIAAYPIIPIPAKVQEGTPHTSGGPGRLVSGAQQRRLSLGWDTIFCVSGGGTEMTSLSLSMAKKDLQRESAPPYGKNLSAPTWLPLGLSIIRLWIPLSI